MLDYEEIEFLIHLDNNNDKYQWHMLFHRLPAHLSWDQSHFSEIMSRLVYSGHIMREPNAPVILTRKGRDAIALIKTDAEERKNEQTERARLLAMQQRFYEMESKFTKLQLDEYPDTRERALSAGNDAKTAVIISIIAILVPVIIEVMKHFKIL